MKEMQRLVKQLETQKQQLLEQLAAAAPAQGSIGSPAGSSGFDTDGDGAAESPRPAGRQTDEFVRLAAEIEAVRRENAALTQRLRSRDLFNSVMQNLLLEFESPPQEPAKESVVFTPLTQDEGAAVIARTMQQMASARALYACESNFADRATVFGWREFTFRRHTTITFTVKKSLPNTVPSALLDATWRLVTDSRNIQRLIRPQLSTTVTPLQVLSPSAIVIDRRTEDAVRTGVGNKMLAMRTVYLLFRTQAEDGSHVLAMKTIDLPLVKRLLRDDELWCDIFYWIRFAPDESGVEGVTLAEFGGVNTYVREEIASSWLAELVFLAVRWESLAVAPLLLKG